MEFRTKTMGLIVASALSIATFSTAQAAIVNATSYAMNNGDGYTNGGTYNYWDLAYSGAGSPNVDASPLSGGLGDLTDGVIATDNWFNVENGSGTGPYVGWRNRNPTIDFFFSAITAFTNITFHVDDSDGAGGVDHPESITINSTNYLIPLHGGAAPYAITISLAGLMTNVLNVQLFGSNEWVFVSEVTFDGTPAAVPVPAAGLLLLGALGGLAALRRRNRVTA